MKKFYCFLLLFNMGFFYAQDGEILTTFNTTNYYSGKINAMLELEDGSIIYAKSGPGPLDFVQTDLFKVSSTGAEDLTFDFIPIPGNARSLCLQDDGKIILGGNFGVIRINSTGSVDNSFVNPSIANHLEAIDVVIQPVTNKILVANQNVSNNKGILRLNNNGSIDNTFNSIGSGIPFGWGTNYVNDIETYSDGSIIIVGNFSSYQDGISTSSNRSGIAKLNIDGTLNNTTYTAFSLNTALDAAIQTDGKIVVVGGNNNGSTIPQIVRFNTNGTVDTTYNPPMPGAGVTNHKVNVIEMQSDGKMIIGGNFQNFEGSARSSIARLNYDGSLDLCFDPGYGLSNTPTTGSGLAFGLMISSDNNLFICGDFTYYDGNARVGIVKVRTETPIQAVDDFPAPITQGTNGIVLSSVLSEDTLLGSQATTSNVTISLESSDHVGITLDTITGAVSVASTVPVGSYLLYYNICQTSTGNCNCDTGRVSINVGNTSVRANALVNRSGLQSDGKIIITGYFTAYNGITTKRIAKLNTNLTLDTSFNASGPMPAAETPYDMVVQPDNKIIVVGTFDGWSGASNGRCITRLLPDGNNDVSFNPGGAGAIESSGNYAIYTVALQTDGKILIGGRFQSFNGMPRNFVARLNSNGSVDNSFIVNSGFDSAPTGIAVQNDGKIIMVGHFNTYQGISAPRIVRLNSNGTIDTAFSSAVGTGFTGGTTDAMNKDVYLQPDGKIIVIGSFTAFNGVSKNNIVRLNSNGTLDTSFIVGTGFNNRTRALAFDPTSSKIFIGGDFTSYNGTTVNKIIRLNPNGTLDSSFSSGSGPAGSVYTLYRQPDAKVIVGGQFNTYNGIAATNVTRIIPSSAGAQGRGIDYFESEPEIDITAADISDLTIEKLNIYPNPSVDIFNLDIRGYDKKEFELLVYNTLGQLIYKNNVTSENIYQIDLSGFEKGNYFVKLQNNNIVINKIITKN